MVCLSRASSPAGVLYRVGQTQLGSFTFSCHCFTLHVSTYTTILRCVGYFYFHIPEEICFAGFFAFFYLFLHVVTLCTFPFAFSCSVFLL
jgi:hypothetical protein